MICKYCEKEVPASESTCPYCGMPVIESKEPTISAKEQAPKPKCKKLEKLPAILILSASVLSVLFVFFIGVVRLEDGVPVFTAYSSQVFDRLFLLDAQNAYANEFVKDLYEAVAVFRIVIAIVGPIATIAFALVGITQSVRSLFTSSEKKGFGWGVASVGSFIATAIAFLFSYYRTNIYSGGTVETSFDDFTFWGIILTVACIFGAIIINTFVTKPNITDKKTAILSILSSVCPVIIIIAMFTLLSSVCYIQSTYSFQFSLLSHLEAFSSNATKSDTSLLSITSDIIGAILTLLMLCGYVAIFVKSLCAIFYRKSYNATPLVIAVLVLSLLYLTCSIMSVASYTSYVNGTAGLDDLSHASVTADAIINPIITTVLLLIFTISKKIQQK